MIRSSDDTDTRKRRSILGLVLALSTSVFILFNICKESIYNVTSLRQINDVVKRNLTPDQISTMKPKIPLRFIFVYLDPDENMFVYDNVLNTIKTYRTLWSENFGEENPNMMFLQNDNCVDIITDVWPELKRHYVDDANINHKSEICRIAALYKYGGYFFAKEMEVIRPLLLAPTTQFASVASTYGHQNAFIASEPGHPVLRNTLGFMEDHYKGPMLQPFLFMGPGTLRAAYESTPRDEIGEQRLLEEFAMTIPFFAHKYPHVPLQQGTGCCCNFAIHEAALQDVFFYTRTVGASDMCTSLT